MMKWGGSQDEHVAELPGDDLIRSPALQTTRSININASPLNVWQWIVQIGQGRGGFYSYDWLENLLGLNIHSADRILPEHQDIKVGDMIPFWEEGGIDVDEINPGEYLVLAGNIGETNGSRAEDVPDVGGSWVFVLREIDPRSTRLIVRTKVADFKPYWLTRPLIKLILEPIHFIMEEKMLRGIKNRAEQ